MTNALNIDDYDLGQAREVVAAFGSKRYGYVVTPNVDHVIRYHDDPQFGALYRYATVVLLDSRFLARLLSIVKRLKFRVCLGSDLTGEVFRSVIKSDDVVVLVGGTPVQAQELRIQYSLKSLVHVDPPMHFLSDDAAVETCLREIEAASPFRFCFLAIGSPQQEYIAYKLQLRGVARGLALCVGAAINFVTGREKRAPFWMQRLSLEWLFRLVQNPRRMAKRYLIRGPRIFTLLPRMRLQLRREIASPRDAMSYPPTVPIGSAAMMGANSATSCGAAPGTPMVTGPVQSL